MIRRPRTPSLFILSALCAFGFLSASAAAAGGAGHGHHGIHRSGGHHGGHPWHFISHAPRSHGVRFTAGFPRYFAGGPYGGYRNYVATGGYRSYGGFYYRTYPAYRFYQPGRTVSTYPVSYAPVADVSVYATPGSVYDPVFQRGVATQPLDDYVLTVPTSVETSSPVQPIYIIVQPAPAGSQPPLQAPQPVAQARPLAVSGGEAGEVFLSVHPANAAVYLDDELLGSGDQLAAGQEPLVLDSGVHVLEVVHPEYQTQRLVFGMPSAGQLQIEFDLEGDRRGRKARVKTLDPPTIQ